MDHKGKMSRSESLLFLFRKRAETDPLSEKIAKDLSKQGNEHGGKNSASVEPAKGE